LVFGYLIGRVLIVLLLLPGYFRGEFLTAYALIEKRFGERMRAVAASTFLITRAIAEGVRVSAIALVVSVVLGTSEKLAVVLVIALTVLYTFEGGMRAVIWTDVAQLFALSHRQCRNLFRLAPSHSRRLERSGTGRRRSRPQAATARFFPGISQRNTHSGPV